MAVSRVPRRSRAPGRSEEGILCRPVGLGGGSEQFGEVFGLGRPLVYPPPGTGHRASALLDLRTLRFARCAFDDLKRLGEYGASSRLFALPRPRISCRDSHHVAPCTSTRLASGTMSCSRANFTAAAAAEPAAAATSSGLVNLPPVTDTTRFAPYTGRAVPLARHKTPTSRRRDSAARPWPSQMPQIEAAALSCVACAAPIPQPVVERSAGGSFHRISATPTGLLPAVVLAGRAGQRPKTALTCGKNDECEMRHH
ncbi:hypothetical protein GA0115239_11584 [Streptomyces sp. BpilaLS-43]|nr:hypothetical protein GA0115239_11584 [Streptomyces sp. BpilaLS-43]